MRAGDISSKSPLFCLRIFLGSFGVSVAFYVDYLCVFLVNVICCYLVI